MKISLNFFLENLVICIMSSPEVEKFEVTDYDLENEFNPNRRQRRQTKNQATYGKWSWYFFLHTLAHISSYNVRY